ncbi:MAG: M1 family metallopeptidase [Cyclobacteriaceae bacterium]|nr:M1 family metallopeptidase [Cyclobacteriaceae bacterium]UYN85931.1 MAG: M1 family metallopeptidase [Cyclobacteriaceae bacterium]
MKSRIFLLLFAVSGYIADAQTKPSGLYMPIEFQKAYEKGTRKLDGSVSPTYWQNRSIYKIKATVDPHTKLLKGEATITYLNNTPDTVRNPTFHTYHDYYKPESKKAGFFSGGNAPDANHKGVIIEKLVVDNETYDINNRDEVFYGGTNYTVRLRKPLPPKSSMELKINWNYVIPGKGFERSGAIDSTSMFVGYWYPEMAVLDDIDLWDRIVYDAATEFYHDYSDYEIELTVPDNFMVWASVAPSNPDEVYSSTIRERLTKARASSTPVNIFTEADFKKSSTKNATWKYTAKNFPDFAFALSNHFVWDACTYKDALGEYFINTAYPTNHPEFAAVLEAIQESLKVFHTRFPVYAFPFKHFTIFNGLEGGGMEFPGMANDQEMSGAMIEQWTGKKVSDMEAQLGLTLHEMCHMYFPFMMGINEKKYAWMDEGFASFSEYFIDPLFPAGNWDQPYLGSQRVLPIMVPSHIAEGSGLNSYTVGSYSYVSLYQLLGKDLFLKCLHAYMNEWKHKHPTPYDFMFTFNRVSGQDLNWFWNKWYFDWGYMDVGINEVKNNVILIENKGGRPLAFSVTITFHDGTTTTQDVSPMVWKASKLYNHKVNAGKKKIKSVQLTIPTNGDADGKNNTWIAK